MLNGGGYESFLGLAVIFVLLSSQFPNRFLVSLLLDRFLSSLFRSHFGKGGPNYSAFWLKNPLMWLNLFSGNRMSFEA